MFWSDWYQKAVDSTKGAVQGAADTVSALFKAPSPGTAGALNADEAMGTNYDLLDQPTPGMDPGRGEVIEYDAALPYKGQTGINKGCPPGYHAEITYPDAPMSIPHGDGSNGIRCRLLDTTGPVSKEGGMSPATRVFTQVADTLRQSVETITATSGGFFQTTLSKLLIGLVVVGVIIIAANIFISRVTR